MWHSHQKMIKNEYVRLCKGIRPTTHKDIRIWLRLNLRTPNSSSSLVIFRGGITLYHPFSWTLPLLPRIFFIATMPMFKSCLGVLPLLRGPCFETCGFRMDGSQWAIRFSMGWLKAPFPKAASSTSFSLSGVSRWIFGRPGFFNGGLGSVWIHWPFWVHIHLSMFEVFRCFLVGLWGISVFS